MYGLDNSQTVDYSAFVWHRRERIFDDLGVLSVFYHWAG